MDIIGDNSALGEDDDDLAPVPILKTKANSIPGCAVQVSIQDSVTKKRRKFVISILSAREPQKELNLFFDSDQLESLSLQIVGRPHLNAKKCVVHLVGTFILPFAFGRELGAALFENAYHDTMKQLKQKRFLENEGKPMESKKRQHDSDEESDESDSSDSDNAGPTGLKQIGPKTFIHDGVSIFELITGHGKKAKIGDRVRIAYKGKLDPTKSKCFDKATIAKPYEFTLGSKRVIPGINLAVEGMCRESMRELIIPSHLGFGQAGLGDRVPPNATLYYDMTLKEIIPKKLWKKQQVDSQKMGRKRQQEKQKETKRLLQVGNRIKL